MLSCVANVSEGRDGAVLAALSGACGAALLDVHTDPHHHRSVFTLAGPHVEDAARGLVAEAVARIDLRAHAGVHPRLGAADVVPFVPLTGATLADAVRARDAFAQWAGAELGVPCFLYGPERTLPEVRQAAFTALTPDTGPPAPHPTAGAICVGARGYLVAYNVWLAPPAGVDVARRVAAGVRRPALRALGLDVGGRAQVSCNLIAPLVLGPAAAYDAVAAAAAGLGATVDGAELVGLLPMAVLESIEPARWAALDLSAGRTLEARLAEPRQ